MTDSEAVDYLQNIAASTTDADLATAIGVILDQRRDLDKALRDTQQEAVDAKALLASKATADRLSAALVA